MTLVSAISAQPQIAVALQQASSRTGADFNYLLNTAMRESSLDCDAKSTTSTACGLFQFTQQTWLSTLKTEGSSLGLSQYADAIRQDSRGRYVVDDPAARQEILALRNDPQVSALMAGAYANNSRTQLESKLGRDVNSGELYIAHFLGAGGASKLISQAEDAPQARADVLFPEAAAANKSIFYDKDGQPRTAGQLYNLLVSKHQNSGAAVARFEIAPRPNLDRAASTAISAMPELDGEDDSSSDAIAALPMMTVSAKPMSRPMSQSVAQAITASDAIGRSPLQLSPAVLNVLASLDAPATSEDDKSGGRKERNQDNRLLPRGGFALG